MRVLIVKMSSMGDIIHTLPALTDAAHAIPDITFDWVVEENFQEIPAWHRAVKNVIPIALRRWRKNLFAAETRQEFAAFARRLRKNNYDLIIDAQGLLKSALIAAIARGVRVGPDAACARDPLASILYQKKFPVGKVKEVHAVIRTRQLFSKALGYVLSDTAPDYGCHFYKSDAQDNYLVFLHGTTWATKHWPESYWIELAKIAAQQGFKIKISWGNQIEHERAMRIAAASDAVEILPKLALKEMATVLASAKAIVAVDTGLGHLAAALNIPTVSLYGPTNPDLTGAMGVSQKWLKADFPCSPCLGRECTYAGASTSSVQPPCFVTLMPARVWEELKVLLCATFVAHK